MHRTLIYVSFAFAAVIAATFGVYLGHALTEMAAQINAALPH